MLNQLRPLYGEAPSLSVRVLDDRTFAERYKRLPKEHSEDVILAVFGLLSPEAFANFSAGGNVFGFYDAANHEVVLRQGHDDRYSLLQELAYALVRNLRTLDTDDAGLALHLLDEGHAQLLVEARKSRDQGIPLARIALDPGIVSGSRLVHQSLFTHRGDPTGEFLSDWEALEHVGSVVFIALLARTGGLPFVLETLHDPPYATADLIFPIRFLTDEPDYVLPGVPVLGPGSSTLAAGTLGALRLGSLVASCLGPDAAWKFAAMWRGDRFVIGARQGKREVLWTTVWSSAAAAASFEDALPQLNSCRSVRGLPPFEATARDNVVFLWTPGHASAVSRVTPSSTFDRYPPRRAPRVDFSDPGFHDTVANGKYLGDALGVEMRTPDGYDAEPKPNPPFFGSLVATNHAGLSKLVVVTAPGGVPMGRAGDLCAKLLSTSIEGIRDEGVFSLRLPAGLAVGRKYSASASSRHSAWLALPVCDRTANLVIFLSWGSDAELNTLVDSLRSIRPASKTWKCDNFKPIDSPA